MHTALPFMTVSGTISIRGSCPTVMTAITPWSFSPEQRHIAALSSGKGCVRGERGEGSRRRIKVGTVGTGQEERRSTD